jgi:cysteine sulfinate desulfinase/cysteine desulfurase-like protein
MGLSEREAYASVRFSFGEENTIEELDSALAKMIPIIHRLRDILV